MLGDDGEAVGFGERREKLGSLLAGESVRCSRGRLFRRSHARTGGGRGSPWPSKKTGFDGGLVQVGVPLHDEQRRADEFLEGDVGRDGIARQANDGHTAGAIVG